MGCLYKDPHPKWSILTNDESSQDLNDLLKI